jgi:hypothetical protein
METASREMAHHSDETCFGAGEHRVCYLKAVRAEIARTARASPGL